MRFSTFFFDLDDTLYPPAAGLWEQIGGRINLYLSERMGFPPENVQAIREKYFRQYGTTLRGLQANHQVDMDDYLAFVHDVPLDQYIQPNQALRSALESIPARKFIFTNADVNHARRVMSVVGVGDLFEGIIDVHAIAPYCKPMPEAFRLAMRVARESDPGRCVMIDDLPHTTRAARQFGMYSVLYGCDGSHPDADACLSDWRRLPALLASA